MARVIWAAAFILLMGNPLLAQKALRSIELETEMRQAIEEAIRQRLKHPQSAVFGDMNAGRAPLWVTVCGWVDRGADDGDYLEKVPFMVRYLPLDRQISVIGIGPQMAGRCAGENVPLP